MGLQRAQIGEVLRIQIGLVGNFRKQIKEAVNRRQKCRVIAQLTTQLVANTATKVHVCNGNDINSSNDEFHGNRHTSKVNKLRAFLAVAIGLWQWSEYKTAFRWHVLEPMPGKGIG